MQRLRNGDDDYEDILAWIQEGIQPARKRNTELAHEKTMKREKHHRDFFRSLTFERMETRVDTIEPSLDKTCTWLLSKDDYKSWLKEDRGLLWIKGKPGSGKSTLMKWALKNHPATDDNNIVASFFFDARGEAIHRSLEGSYRHLLVQIADQNMGVLEEMSAKYQRYCKMHNDYGKGCIWEEKELHGLLSEAIMDASNESHVWIYVDALDECGEEAAQRYPYASPVGITLFFHYEYGGEIKMEENNGLDIGAYVERMLQGRHLKKDLIAVAKPEIVSKAQGTFQWVRIVVGILMKSSLKGSSHQRIIQQIRSLPDEIKDLYDKVLLEPEDAVDSLRLMKWVCFALRPLSLAELRFALILDTAPACTSLEECQNHMDFVETDSTMELRVNYLSRGLAEVQEQEEQRVIRFIHQTVNDYLIAQGLQKLEGLSKGEKTKVLFMDLPDEVSKDVDLEDAKRKRQEKWNAEAHRQISRSCIRYIFMPEVLSLAESPSRKPPPSTQRLDTEFQFLRYCVRNWLSHTRLVDEGGIDQTDLLELFEWPSAKMVEAYIALWLWTFPDSGRSLFLIPGSSLLHIAAQHNLLSVVNCILEADGNKVHIVNERRQTPLHKAALMGLAEMSRILLDRGAPVDFQDTDDWTPLQFASYFDHGELAELLLKRKANPNLLGKEEKTPLHTAVQKLSYRTINVLLEHGAEIDATNNHGQTPLFSACDSKSARMIALLLEKNSNPNIKDANGFTPLIYASRKSGSDAVVEQLLTEGADQNTADKNGYTPLIHATIGKLETVAAILLQHGADPNIANRLQWTPLMWSAQNSCTAVARMLIQKGADVNCRDASYVNTFT